MFSIFKSNKSNNFNNSDKNTLFLINKTKIILTRKIASGGERVFTKQTQTT